MQQEQCYMVSSSLCSTSFMKIDSHESLVIRQRSREIEKDLKGGWKALEGNWEGYRDSLYGPQKQLGGLRAS